MSAIFVHAPLPGGGYGIPLSRASTRLLQFLEQKQTIIQIKKDPGRLCCARAIVVGLAYAGDHPRKVNIKRGVRYQCKLARAVMYKAGIPPGTLCGPEHWDSLQRVIGPDYSLTIVSRELFNSIVYRGNPGASRNVCLYVVGEHYHVITKLPAFFGVGYVCPYCLKTSDSIHVHTCDQTCYYCRAKGQCVAAGREMYCRQCNIRYPTETCHARHLTLGMCAKRSRCKSCGKVTMKGRPHRCGYRLCPRCKAVAPVDHQCYMQPLKRCQRETDDCTYIFYDFESMTEVDGRHAPNLCVVHEVCTTCIHVPMGHGTPCDCGRRQIVFKGPTTLRDFGEYLFDGTNAGATCIAHNSSGYDAHLVLSYLHDVGVKPQLIMNGRKIMCLKAGGVRLIDSLNFFAMGLAKLPKAFGVEELCKGYFPHLFNVAENQGYVGPIPAIEYYAPDQMSAEGRLKFLHWYRTQQGAVFDMQAELLRYCKSDVDILQRCCGIFRNLFVEYSGLEPFTKSLTIASACNRVYRTDYLEANEIALIPPEGVFKGRQSSIALCWLTVISREKGLDIQHYGNAGERRIEGRLVDGVDSEGKLYFFHGCFWHSCEKCFINRDEIHPVKGVSHRENYDHTLAFTAELRDKGYDVTVKWECDFRATMTQESKDVLKDCQQYEPLRPRDAFYGGRCNSIRLHAKPGDGEAIKYVDFTSLYPYVNKYSKYPIKHPEIYTGADIPEVVEGLLKCKVLPPQNLYHPVLPYRARGKLLFPLCRACAETNHQGPCPHNDPETRALIGTWVTCELEKALSLGYRVLEKYECWHFPNVSVYDPVSKTGGIWASFIDKWVQLKQQASGYPDHVKTTEEKARYVHEYEQHEGIRLDPDRIERNEGLRSLAKLMANSHWGKASQRSINTQVTYVDDPLVYVKMMSDRTIEVHDIHYVNDKHVALQWSRLDDFDTGLPYTNVVLACYTTAAARLKLYELLERLQDRVLYMDTDSVIYLHREDAFNPTTSDYLGGLKDEVPDTTITEFVSPGPKNYALRTADGASMCKVRGFTLNYQTSKLINIDTMLTLVNSHTPTAEGVVVPDPNSIRRNKDGALYTLPHHKRYTMVYDKRYIEPDGISTKPFGWR